MAFTAPALTGDPRHAGEDGGEPTGSRAMPKDKTPPSGGRKDEKNRERSRGADARTPGQESKGRDEKRPGSDSGRAK